MDSRRITAEEIHARFRRIGTAICRINANNTHSGNLSMRDPYDDDLFYITSSGAQCGNLVTTDIVPVRFSGVSWGDARGSTESTIHRRILSLPEARAVVHAHSLYSTFISFDTREKELFLCYLGENEKGCEEFLFHPVDAYGAFAIGDVHIGSYFQPVGSAEMEERIPGYLKDDYITVVKGHGPFIKGRSPEDALYRLSVFELSSRCALHLRRRGVNIVELQKAIRKMAPVDAFRVKPHLYDDSESPVRESHDQTLIEDFQRWLIYNYDHAIGSFGTGSMSQKISAEEMVYCPMSALPEGFQFPLTRMKIEILDGDSTEQKIHKLIYQNTHLNACMMTTSPLATAEGMAVLAEVTCDAGIPSKKREIDYSIDDHPVVIPIDAEAIYLNPRLGLVDIDRLVDCSPQNPILNMLRWHKGCCIVAGYGVISAGETTLEQAAHHAASAERIARFRSEVTINEKTIGGPSVRHFEPK